MALVLRKAFSPRNASILKCIKGRPLATAPNKKHTAALFMPAARRIYKVKALTSALTKTRRTRLPSTIVQIDVGKGTTRRLRFSISCPHVGTLIEPKTALSFRQYSSIASSRPFKRNNSLHQISLTTNSMRSYASCNVGCPCPFPCGPCGCKGGCGCLPPPCNTPPKCLQYMTGYYYYPYGTWFCGPYHVSGTCTPVGANCPCPCPVKCCPACVCAPVQNYSTNKNVSDVNQFPMEIPCHSLPKIPQEARGGAPKLFNFNAQAASKKDSQHKQKPTKLPPVMSTMLCPDPYEGSSTLIDREPKITCSYPTADDTPKLKPKSRFYHTKTNPLPAISSSNTPVYPRQKNWKYFYYQSRQRAVTPMERARAFLKENRYKPRVKLDSGNNSSTPSQKRRDPRPDVDIEIKPYDDGRMN